MNGEGFIDDRIGTAMTIAVVGSACGGSLIGSAMVQLGYAPAGRPLLFAATGTFAIIATTMLTGWYLPKKGELPDMTAMGDN